MALRQSLRELAEDFQSIFAGGQYSVDTIPSTQVVQKQLIKLRADAIRKTFIRDPYLPELKRIVHYNPNWCLHVDLKRDKAQQPTFGSLNYGYSRFELPPVIDINGMVDGFISVAGATQTCRYERLSGGFEQYMQLLDMGDCLNEKYWWVQDGAINVNDKVSTYIRVRVCPEDPTEWLTWDESTKSYVAVYNPNTEPFLVTADIIGIMRDMFKEKYANPMIPVDTSLNHVPNTNEKKNA